MITLKGTTVTIISTGDVSTNMVMSAFSPDDLKNITKNYNERKKRIKKAWQERKQKNILLSGEGTSKSL